MVLKKPFGRIMNLKSSEETHQKQCPTCVALTVGPRYVGLITEMPLKLSFDNLKTPKICFQFP